MPDTFTITGTIKLLNNSSVNLLQQAISGTVQLSVFAAQQVIVSAGISTMNVSQAVFSNVQVLFITSDKTVRVNIANLPSSVSAASAGFQFMTCFAIAGSNISGARGLYFANSGASDASVTVYWGQ